MIDTIDYFEGGIYKAGDILTENLSFFVWILKVINDDVFFLESYGKIAKLNKEEFKNKYSYKHIRGFYVRYLRNDIINTKNVLSNYIKSLKTLDEKREVKIELLVHEIEL